MKKYYVVMFHCENRASIIFASDNYNAANDVCESYSGECELLGIDEMRSDTMLCTLL